eukprot:gene17691-21097_t
MNIEFLVSTIYFISFKLNDKIAPYYYPKLNSTINAVICTLGSIYTIFMEDADYWHGSNIILGDTANSILLTRLFRSYMVYDLIVMIMHRGTPIYSIGMVVHHLLGIAVSLVFPMLGIGSYFLSMVAIVYLANYQLVLTNFSPQVRLLLYSCYITINVLNLFWGYLIWNGLVKKLSKKDNNAAFVNQVCGFRMDCRNELEQAYHSLRIHLLKYPDESAQVAYNIITQEHTPTEFVVFLSVPAHRSFLMEHRHRSGPLKQQNKTFKSGRHDSKGAMKRRAAGKVETNARTVGIKKTSQAMHQKQAKIIQSKKAEAIERRRLGLPELNPPRVISIIALTENCDTIKTQAMLLKKFQGNVHNGNSVCLSSKVRATFLACPSRDVNVAIEYAKVADIVLFVVDSGCVTASERFDEMGERLCSVIKAQGVPSSMMLMQSFDKIVMKRRSDTKKHIQTIYHFHFPEEPKVLAGDSEEDMSQVLRFVETMHINDLLWRLARPFLYVERVDYIEGQVVLEGYLRGNNMSAKQLIYVPDFGDFQVSKIEEVKDPNSSRHSKGNEMASEPRVIDTSKPEERESLQSYNIPDPNEQEQTMPTNEEIEMANQNRKKKLVPKGTSSYQASWYLDDEDDDEEGFYEDEEEEDDEEDVDMDAEDEEAQEINEDGMMAEDNQEEEEESSEEELEEIDPEEDKWKGKTKEDIEAMKAKEKAEKEDEEMEKLEKEEQDEEEDDETKREQNELEFPDEVDTPDNIPSRIRFSKFRGLKSFRSSPWDAMENLPMDYARIFQFHSFNQSMRKALEIQATAPAKPGMYVRIHLVDCDVGAAIKTAASSSVVVATGSLKYENKVSVIHFAVEKHRLAGDAPIRSKEPVVMHAGFRRFEARPLYSVSAPNCDKQKYEKYLHAGRNSVASIYAPIMFPPAPLIVFGDASCTRLVATGHLASVNPDRILCKRIILTGGIAKSISRKFVTVRDMFYFPEDIEYFKKVELYTKMGRAGHIKESLGTHGRMKCLFDSKINMQDTICMNLYKRVFPKWTIPLLEEDPANQQQQQQMMESSSNQ